MPTTIYNNRKRLFVIGDDQEMTADLLLEYVRKHQGVAPMIYKPLEDAYMTDYPIIHQVCKAAYKPDNRLCANFAKYAADVFGGFFCGIPIKTDTDDQQISDYLTLLDRYNGLDSVNAELARHCDVYGHAYEIYYVDEDGQVAVSAVSPMDGFMIYDESIRRRPRYFVRYYTDVHGTVRGSISDDQVVRYFTVDTSLRFTGEEKLHGFDGVPATEYQENDVRTGIFEPVMSLINAFNKVLSEKSNDIDYFSDAYMKILGARLETDDLKTIRDDRIINLESEDNENLVVEFMEKPDADGSQEHLLDRLHDLIFQISMVADISDEDFGNASGISLKYKLLTMNNLAKTKERLFSASFDRRYRLIFSNPINAMKADDWVQISYKYSRNIPTNILDEAQTAAQLAGTTSLQTRLGVLSVVDNVQDEMDRIAQEQDIDAYATMYPTDRTGEDNGGN